MIDFYLLCLHHFVLLFRWETLQEVLKSWEQYRNQEQRLNDWLYEKEKGLKDISLFDMGDKEEVQKQIQKLKVREILFFI